MNAERNPVKDAVVVKFESGKTTYVTTIAPGEGGGEASPPGGAGEAPQPPAPPPGQPGGGT